MGDGIVPRPSDCARCRELLGRIPAPYRQRLESRVGAALESSTRQTALFGATAELAELTGSDRCSVLVPCGHSALRIVASSESRDVGDLLVSLDRYPELAWLLEHREPVLISDVVSDPLLVEVREPMRDSGIVSLAAAPVRLGNIDGILRLLSRQRRLEAADLDVLITASHLAEHVIAADPEPQPADWRWTQLALQAWDVVLEVRADARVAAVWGAPERFGLESAAIPGRFLDDLLVGVEAEQPWHRVLELLQQPITGQFVLTGGAGTTAVTARSTHASGPVGNVLVAVADRRLEEEALHREAGLRAAVGRQLVELDTLNRQLDALEVARATFLSASAHEFKTPLTVIQSYLEILLNDLSAGLSPEQLSFLRIAFDSVLRLRRLVVDLVDLAAMESGRIQLEIGEVDVRPLIGTVVEELQPLAQRASIDLPRLVTCALPTVRADGDRVQQVLRNLLDNAIKYTPAGGRVWVETSVEGDSVVVSICDTGIGIAGDQLSAIFEEFYRADHTGLGRRQGAGLGLTISRRIMRALGGRITVSSSTGQGSSFSIYIPRWPRADAGA